MAQTVELESSRTKWVEWRSDGHDIERVRVRVESREGRLVIVEVDIADRRGVSTELMRTVPLGDIESVINLSPNITSELLGTPSFAHPSLTKMKLKIPAGTGRKPDAFYETVAALYRDLVKDRKAPAVTIAAANGVPVTQVHRWIREARHRGFLPKAKAGRAG